MKKFEIPEMKIVALDVSDIVCAVSLPIHWEEED